jgi:hypothetical protein
VQVHVLPNVATYTNLLLEPSLVLAVFVLRLLLFGTLFHNTYIVQPLAENSSVLG